MSLDFNELGLNEAAVDALKKVLMVESPEVGELRAKRQRITAAPKIDTITQRPDAWQIILSQPRKVFLKIPGGAVCTNEVSSMYSGIELSNPTTDEVATMSLLFGVNYVPASLYESFEADREVRKLVESGAIQAYPPGLHVGLETLSAETIDRAVETIIHYEKGPEDRVFAALERYAPHMPQGAKRDMVQHMIRTRKNALLAAGAADDAPAEQEAALPKGLIVTTGARVLPD